MATVRALTAFHGEETKHSGSAFDHLFLEQYPRVVSIAYRVLGDRHAAEDVAQEVFLSFHGRADPREPWAPSWLWAASAHRALNLVRGTKRRRDRELRVPVPASAASPEEDAIVSEQRSAVRSALGRLPERAAEVLVLWATGLSYADIAMAVGTSPSGVGTLVCRAQRALRKELTNVETS
ncbi:MAG: sigma-70 family RNA polymerase sigma factor [Acidimicrobiales bacterium]|jgi:RNA polymerase sigma-70 factor (ECF subfamily)